MDELLWKNGPGESSDFSRFRQIHVKLQPSVFWQTAYKRPKSRSAYQFMAKIVSHKIIGEPCLNCDLITEDILLHVAFECNHKTTGHIRNSFWCVLQTNFDVDIYNKLTQFSKKDLLTLMLGGQDNVTAVFKVESDYTRGDQKVMKLAL